MDAKTQECLKVIATRLSHKELKWALVGSTSLYLQGVDIDPHDIDILTTEQDIYKIQDQLKAFVTSPVEYKESEHFRSHFGKFEINGVKVEVMANLQSKTEDESWSDNSRIDAIVKLKHQTMEIPVISLEEEYKAYIRMGRLEKAERIKQAINSSK